jgi:endonuclease/exonuclease/phosphatase family metal-dependent hydrolase
MKGFIFLAILVVGSPAYAQQINRALGRPATASSTSGASYTADRAVDGNTGTRWSSAFTNSEWWSVDLGASYSVTKVVINWEAAYATAYDLQVSSDGVAWTTFFSGTNSFPVNSAGTSTATTPAGVNAVGRYVRVVGKNRAIVWGGQWGYSAWEIQVFGDPPAAPPAPPPTAPPASPATPSPANSGTGISISTALGWSAANGATSYTVAFGASSPPPQAATGLAATSFQPTASLAYSTTYYWRITAVNAAGSTTGPIWSFTTAAAPPPPPPPVNNTALKRLRIVSWNIAQGYTVAGQHDQDDQLDLIASLKPDVVVLNEVSLADNDMPAYYAAGLQSRTSKTWNRLFAQTIAGASPANAQGTMILTWLPVDDKSSDVYCAVPGDTRAPNDSSCTGFVRMAVTVNSVPLQIAGVHLNWYDASYRSLQMDELRRWLANYGANQLVVGDFNAEPDETSLWANWLTSRRDVWAQVTAAAGEPGFTKDKRSTTGKPGRIDYQFVPIDPAHIGVQQFGVVHTVLSDHHVLVADYVVQ